MNYKKKYYQIFCQINLFKHYYKIIFSFILIFILGCSNKINKVYDLVSIDRFEKKFFNADSDSLSKLINDYPFLFPSNFNKEEWVNIKNDSLRKFIFNESIKKYDDKKLNREISALYSNLSKEFSDFNSPKIITLNNGIDYQFKIITTDSLVLLSLDCYLDNQDLYKNIP